MTLLSEARRQRRVAWKLRHLDQVDSTQAEARRLIAAGEAEGWAIVAAQQSAGRGRLSRAWLSPPGNLYVSLILRPPLPLAGWPQFASMAALAVAETLDRLQVAGVALKWPNDVLVAGRKIAGVLSESVSDYLVIGIGLNVNADVPPDLPDATSLKLVLGHAVDLPSLLQALLGRLDNLLEDLDRGESLTERWAARLQTLGRSVRVQSGERTIVGVAERVTADGALVVRLTGGVEEVFHAADVTLNPGSV